MESQRPFKIILITGCSSGFGLLATRHLAARGHRIIATLRNPEKTGVIQVACQHVADHVDIQILNVCQEDHVRQVADYIRRQYGRLDAVVNNAGYGLGGFFGDLSDSEFRAQMETNFFGALNVIRANLPLLHQSTPATIVNISSTAGLTATPGLGAYNASKWALEGFSEALRLELKPFGIRVCLIEPGPFPTKALFENARFAKRARTPDSLYRESTEKVFALYQASNRDLHSDPMDVVYRIEKCILHHNPPFRNVLGPNARLRYYIRRFFPWRFYEWLIGWIINRAGKSTTAEA